MMRPSVPSPTGTEIGALVSVTSWPRTRPSEMSMAMPRTVFSPRCCATSSTSLLPLLSVVSALRMGGRERWNSTATTAPIPCMTRPVALETLAIMNVLVRKFCAGGDGLKRLGAGDDLDQFLGDHRLAGAVVAKRVFLHHFAGVAGGVVHCAHLRTEERRLIFKQSPINAHGDRARKQLGEDFSLVRLIVVDRRGLILRAELRWDKLLSGRDLRNHGPKARVKQRADVKLAFIEQRNHLFGDRLGGCVGDRAHGAQVDQLQDLPLMRPAKLIIAFLADAKNLDCLALPCERISLLAREAHDGGVERAAQPALASAYEQEMRLVRAAADQKLRTLTVGRSPGQIRQHRFDLLRIGPRRFDRALRATQLRHRDHLHCLGDFLRRLDRRDPVPEFL